MWLVDEEGWRDNNSVTVEKNNFKFLLIHVHFKQLAHNSKSSAIESDVSPYCSFQ